MALGSEFFGGAPRPYNRRIVRLVGLASLLDNLDRSACNGRRALAGRPSYGNHC